MAFIDIILLALIAIFLVLRLRAILGERQESDRRRQDGRFEESDIAGRTNTPAADQEKVVVLNVKQRHKTQVQALEEENAKKDELRKYSQNKEVRKELEVIINKYPSFSIAQFMHGAESAFGVILKAYAQGETEKLKQLLSPDMLKTFAHGIEEHKKKKQQLEFSLVGVEGKITDVDLHGTKLRLSVLFTSEQVNLIKDANGNILDGDPKAVEHCEDTWIFEKNMRASSPIWVLVEMV